MILKSLVNTLCCLVFALPVIAGEIISSSVEHEDERYIVEVDMRIDADPGKVYELITSYENLQQLNDNIEKSELLYSLDDNNHRVRVISDACVMFFCKTITQVQDIQEVSNEVIVATVIPEKSSFDYAHARWHIRKEGEATRITFNSDLKPSFWVPPVIGPPMIKSKLEDEVLGTIETLEELANNNDTETIQ